jgi:hypothetical protein
MGRRCEITVQGRLTPTLVSEFEELGLRAVTRPVVTVLDGDVEDQAAFHGLLRRMEALGIEIIEVRRNQSSSS